MGRIMVLSGGGIKSAVAAARYIREHEVVLLHVDLGHPASTSQAKALAMLAASWPKARLFTTAIPQLKNLSSAVRAGSGLVSSLDPARSKADEAGRVMAERGFLPLMLSVAARGAMQVGAESIVVGASAYVPGEDIGLPGPQAGADALREALHAFDIMFESLLRPQGRIRVETPLIDLTYAQIIKLGQRYGIPWERTYSCQKPTGPCGDCLTCQSRAKAFLEAAVLDPISTTAAVRPKPVAAVH